MTSFARTALLASAASAAVLLSGCSSSNSQDVSYGSIASNPMPELIGFTERPVDRHSHIMQTKNFNTRSLSDDFLRFFYLDHPSHLTPYPLMDLTGQLK